MLGALIGAGASLAGGLFNKSNAEKQAKLQEKFAKNAIQWKAEDAKAAGISKLYALGANTTSYAPVSVGGGVGDAISTAGQNIGRAVDATASPAARGGHLATELAATQLEGLKIDNDIKRADLLSRAVTRNQPGQPPALLNQETTPLVPGQGNSAIKLERKLQPGRQPDPHVSVGVSPEIDMYRTRHGFTPEVPSELGEAQESQPLAAFQWFMRNKILPTFDQAHRTYPYPAPEGQVWQFNPLFGEYTLRPSSTLPAHDRHWYNDQLSRYRNQRGPR